MAIRVDMNQSAIDAMVSDWSSPVGLYIERLATEVQQVAKDMAPVSPRGSKYAPPGYLRSRVHLAHQHRPDGTVFGMVGVPLSKGSRYPLPFVDNPRGATRNANKAGGRTRRYGYRRAADRFLLDALNSVMGGR
jgi:hypothetical protein